MYIVTLVHLSSNEFHINPMSSKLVTWLTDDLERFTLES